MSHTQFFLKATCEVASGTDLDDFVTNIVDYLGNHEEELEALPGLADEPAEDAHRIIKAYLDLEGSLLKIKHASEEYDASDTDIAEFLCNHIAYLMTSPHMEVTWVSIDSREGLSINHYLLGPGGETIDAGTETASLAHASMALAKAVAKALYPEIINEDPEYPNLDPHEWGADTLDEICQALIAHRPDLLPESIRSQLP